MQNGVFGHGFGTHRPAATKVAHLVGVAGAGMRALTDVLIGSGWQVTGSDLSLAGVSRRRRTQFHCVHSKGSEIASRDPGRSGTASYEDICLYEGHAAENVPPQADVVIASDAVPADNPEIGRARELGIPVCSYFEMLGRLMEGKRGLAVAGTHGKSTTTTMAGHILTQAGLDPTVVCGATPLDRTSGGRYGTGDLMLVEACEYRANFLHLRPRQAVILGIEHDHFDCYDTLAEVEQAFAQFAAQIPPDGLVLARHDCPATRRATAGLTCRVETFGFDPAADWWAIPDAFAIHHRGRHLFDVQLQVPGRHNVLNALAAAALAWENGVTVEEIARGLASFRGLHRRLERRGTWRGATLIDDYAHHPTEVAVSLETVRQMYPGRRVCCVFQPHQALRTARLLDELAASLHNADWVAVADIFRAREGPFRSGEVTAADLARRVCERVRGLPRAVEVAAVHRLDEIARLLENRLAPGDVLITLGAGDIARIYDELLDHSPFNPGTCAGRGDIARVNDDFLDRFRESRAAG